MSRSTRRALSFLPAVALTALLADLPAQPPTTALHWSTYLGDVAGGEEPTQVGDRFTSTNTFMRL